MNERARSAYTDKLTMRSIHYNAYNDFLICDMIKRNESDVGDVVFEILAKTVFKFLCFILLLAMSNPS